MSDDVHQTKQSMFVLVVLVGFLFLNIIELDNKSSKVEYSQMQFIIFPGSLDVPSHPLKTGVIHMIGRRIQTPFIK